MLLLVGIDPGTHTGVATADPATGKLTSVQSMTMLDAMDWLRAQALIWTEEGECAILVILEDARRHVVSASRQKHKAAKFLQGVGSVKRDCALWEGFLTGAQIPFYPKRPNSRMTKWPAAQFARTTGWTTRSNNHGRDAALLVWNINQAMAHSLWREARAKVLSMVPAPTRKPRGGS